MRPSSASVFAAYINEASCERLRWIFRRTIGLGPHKSDVLRDVPKEILKDWPSLQRDLAYRLEALRWERTRYSFTWAEPGLTRENIRPADLYTDTTAVLRGAYDSRWPFWRLVEHLHGDYEPVDDPAWREIAEQLTADRPACSSGTAT